MDSTRWERISTLFHAASERSAEEREAFLRQACAGDDALYAEVRTLLAAEPHAGERLRGLVSDAAKGVSDASVAGMAVGPYRVVRELGHGGMGAVYLAERADGQFDQQVALKLIKRGMDSDQILARFRMERQILARLHHPNIARLLDGGLTDDGRPFFAMEHVEGEPIDQYCDTRRLPVDERLRLFLDICGAVMYAHANLVVHRDLKPENILVAADGAVRLLDFGIAKVLADEDEPGTLTQAGLRVMTPAYASPEQVRGGTVGTATDVYSLGMVLYELLAGRRPYEIESRSPIDVERVVCQTDPDRPSVRLARTTGGTAPTADAIGRARRTETRRLRQRLSGDLDAICLKALRKEPRERYGSVEAFAEDIRRHLDGLPVSARAGTVGYRLRKSLERHRALVGTAAAIVVTISSVVAFYTVRLAQERDRARLEAAKASEVAGFLRGLFEVSDPSESRGETVTARELLDEGALRAEEGLANQPAVQATMMRVIGEVYAGLGLGDQARPLLERALERHRTLYGDVHEEVAASQTALAVVLQDLGELEAAEPLFREALATRRRLFGPKHPQVSESIGHLASWVETDGDYVEAERLFREALALDRTIYPPNDPHVAASVVKLGGVLRRTGQIPEAEPLLREGLALQRSIYGNRHPDVASTVRNLAALLRDKGVYDESEALYREAIELRRAILGDAHPEVATTLNSYAILLDRKGDTERAIAVYREFIELLDQIYQGPHPSTAAAYSNLAYSLKSVGRLDEAAAAFRRSIEVGERVLPEGHPNRAFPLIGLAGVYRERGRFTQAEPLLRQALELRRAALEPGHRYIGEALSELGACLIGLRRHAAAEALLLEAYDVLLEAEGADAGRTRTAARRLAALYKALGRPEEADRYREEAAEAPAGREANGGV